VVQAWRNAHVYEFSELSVCMCVCVCVCVCVCAYSQ